MEIEKVVSISIKDVNGNVVNYGKTIWYTKNNSSELFYGRYRGLNSRNNLIIENVVTGEETSVMPKAVKDIYSSIADFVGENK